MKDKARKVKKPSQAMIFDMTGNQCVWSQAGVIQPTACINAYDCLNCALDRKMKQDIANGRLKDGRVLAGWRVSSDIPLRDAARKKCRHMLSGRVAVKYCVNDYECERCAYHQMIEDEGLSEPLSRTGSDLIHGFALAHGYYYHCGHAWARVEYGGRVRVGLDDFASCLFGTMDEYRLPKLGTTVGLGEPGFGLVRGGHTAECLSPMEGVVVAVNPRATASAAQLRDDPYNEDWLMIIEPLRLRGSLRNLLFGEESRAWMEEEAGKLTAMIAQDTEFELAATGGRAVRDIYGAVPEIGWDRLVEEFLLT